MQSLIIGTLNKKGIHFPCTATQREKNLKRKKQANGHSKQTRKKYFHLRKTDQETMNYVRKAGKTKIPILRLPLKM